MEDLISTGWAIFGALVIAALSALAIYRKGAQDQKRSSDLAAKNRAMDAQEKRRSIEDDIQQDDDLYRRASDAGVVRRSGK